MVFCLKKKPSSPIKNVPTNQYYHILVLDGFELELTKLFFPKQSVHRLRDDNTDFLLLPFNLGTEETVRVYKLLFQLNMQCLN